MSSKRRFGHLSALLSATAFVAGLWMIVASGFWRASLLSLRADTPSPSVDARAMLSLFTANAGLVLGCTLLLAAATSLTRHLLKFSSEPG